MTSFADRPHNRASLFGVLYFVDTSGTIWSVDEAWVDLASDPNLHIDLSPEYNLLDMDRAFEPPLAVPNGVLDSGLTSDDNLLMLVNGALVTLGYRGEPLRCADPSKQSQGQVVFAGTDSFVAWAKTLR